MTLLLSYVPMMQAQVTVKDADLIGTWHGTGSNLADTQITFYADHHYLASFVGIVNGTMTGPWRFEDGKIVKKWTEGKLAFVNQKEQNADGSEQQERIIALEGDTLTTQESGDSQHNVYKRGAASKK